ncbi:FGGY family carbohydrate kinase, partial [Marinobacter sp. 71-i]
MSRFLLGIDAGSTMTKAAVFDRGGREIASSSHRVVIQRPQSGWCEVDPVAAWEAAMAAIRGALDRAGLTGD